MSKHVSYTNPHRLPDSQNLDLTTMEYFLYENLTKTETRNLMRHIIRNSCGNIEVFVKSMIKIN